MEAMSTIWPIEVPGSGDGEQDAANEIPGALHSGRASRSNVGSKERSPLLLPRAATRTGPHSHWQHSHKMGTWQGLLPCAKAGTGQ